MYLKKLDILGFKSFANKTTIHFSSGITAIVGPNGCGKTNILDALRWVLGEQKVTLLRGSKMEEVIFNGTRDMRPLGMAEVTLSLVNNRGVLPTEYSEVQITRRLFRSGESEYLLNKVPCRLKDITELFYDTGVGAHSYSVIQQDMIEAVISDKAEERRFLFEEAAGITKFKQRKRAALRKLEATENDFLRLNDIYAEVKTQVNSLRRQQKKAERYQKVQSAIRDWEVYLGSKRIKNIWQEARELKAKRDRLIDQLSANETSLDSISARLEAERKDQIDIEQELSRVGNQVYEISENAHTLEKGISIHKEKKSNAAVLIERNENEIAALTKRSGLLAEQERETSQTLKNQKAALTDIEEQLREAEAGQAQADKILLAARSAKEQENKLLVELEGQLSSGKTEEDNLRQQMEELKSAISMTESALEEKRQQREAAESDLEASHRNLEELLSSKADCDRKDDDLSQKLSDLVSKSEELTHEIANLTASIEACEARKGLLEDMMLQYEGYESGVKAAMDNRARWPGIYGTVAEKFVPKEGLEVAAEAALGELSRFIICDSRATGEAVIGFLKSQNKGRAGVLVPDTGTINPAVKRPELEMPQFIGWLDNFVTTDDHLTPLMQAVLARTAVFKSGFTPDEILERLPYGFKAVSTSGDVYSKNIISGGSDDKLPLFRRKEKVREQDNMIAEISRQLSAVKSEKDRATAEAAGVRAEQSRLVEKVESLVEEIEAARSKVSEKEYECRAIDAERERLIKEKKNFGDKLEKIGHRQYTLGLDSGQLALKRNELETSISQSSEELSDLEAAATGALQQVSNSQVRLVEARGQIEQIASKLQHQRDLQSDIASNIDTKKREIDQAREVIASSEAAITRLEGELKNAFKERNDIIDRQSALRTKQGELLDRLSQKEKEAKEVRSEKERQSSDAHQLDIRLNTIESELGSITQRITEEYDVNVGDIEAACPDESLSDQEAIGQLRELKEKLKSFGAVNLLALEEYKTAAERKAFLEEQLSDLTAAKEDLQTTITKINHTARQLFLETFNKVKVNFKNLFVELFTGGEADIFLRDPSDPLESDIEIIARPKGKKLLSITMMSGGERALTAISLLFSLYLVKPSPFCVLDEIDAPLDDANCHRFLKIIRKFAEQTQFIIITHNKITMETAHNLYGVTMEQFGVSKLVAVKFSDIESDEAGELIISHEEAVIDGDSEPGNGSTPEITDEASADDGDELPERIKERINPSLAKPTPAEEEEQ
ncbi:MAG: chromosome segregation protein SMC [Candidatus Zixiibacteriota bacterium]|nr:MAG: chromosome segregation protein SMC [candidate division Zixibacteria bacterium]